MRSCDLQETYQSRRLSLSILESFRYTIPVRIIATRTLKAFYADVPAAETAIKTWIKIVQSAEWETPVAVKQDFNSADILAERRVIFDVGGNKFRIVAKINDRAGVVFIRFVGTHAEYDKIDANTIQGVRWKLSLCAPSAITKQPSLRSSG
jgi:mRNA interferase HigB